MAKIEELKKGQKVAGTAIWLEGILVVAKIIIGLLSQSLVLISDAIHSASDLLSIITSWFGLKIAQRKPDERFPYGYYKAESLGTLIISLFILFAFWEMFSHGYSKLSSFSLIKIPLLAMAISLIDALVLFFFGTYEIKIGKQVNAQSLIVMGKENKTHLFSSMVVLIGTLAAYLQIPYIEGLATIAISLLILKIGLAAAKNSIFALMDVSPGKEIEQGVVKTIKSVAGIEEFFDLRLRQSGPFVLGEVKVGIRKSVDVERAHEIADRVESEVKREVSQIESFMVHVEPFKDNWRHLVFPVSEKRELNSKIDDKFSRAAYFLFVNFRKDKLKGFYFLRNPYKEKKAKAGLSIAKLIIKQKSDILITKEIGEIAFLALKENLFDIYQTKDEIVKEVVKSFLKGDLKQLRQATKTF